MTVVRSFIFKLTAEIMVSTRILVIQATVDGRSFVLKSAMLLSKPHSGRGESWRRLVPSAGGENANTNSLCAFYCVRFLGWMLSGFVFCRVVNYATPLFCKI